MLSTNPKSLSSVVLSTLSNERKKSMNHTRRDFFSVMGLGAFSLRDGLASGQEKSVSLRPLKLPKISNVKVTSVGVYYYDLPLHEPFKIAIAEMRESLNVLVCLHTNQGIVGWGEASPFPAITGDTQATSIAVAKDIAELITGQDALNYVKILSAIHSLVPHNSSIKAAFDMALFDILGKVADLPLYKLLGGAKNCFETDLTVSLHTPEETAIRGMDAVKKGFKTIKAKVGVSMESDVARIKALREAVGPKINIRIDANQGWTVPEAIQTLDRLTEYNIQFIEQPVASWDLDGLKQVRQSVKIPVMADEALFSPADALKIIKSEAADYLNIKLMKAGGILPSLKIAHLGEAAGLRCMVGCMNESNLSITAGAHLHASQPHIIFADLDGSFFLKVDPVIGGVKINNGIVTLPEQSGIGAEVDPIWFRKLRKAF
jgi:L-alanine-DL-glutamate epimerase-like enolase superfamily enzyme